MEHTSKRLINDKHNVNGTCVCLQGCHTWDAEFPRVHASSGGDVYDNPVMASLIIIIEKVSHYEPCENTQGGAWIRQKNQLGGKTFTTLPDGAPLPATLARCSHPRVLWTPRCAHFVHLTIYHHVDMLNADSKWSIEITFDNIWNCEMFCNWFLRSGAVYVRGEKKIKM